MIDTNQLQTAMAFPDSADSIAGKQQKTVQQAELLDQHRVGWIESKRRLQAIHGFVSHGRRKANASKRNPPATFDELFGIQKARGGAIATTAEEILMMSLLTDLLNTGSLGTGKPSPQKGESISPASDFQRPWSMSSRLLRESLSTRMMNFCFPARGGSKSRNDSISSQQILTWNSRLVRQPLSHHSPPRPASLQAR